MNRLARIALGSGIILLLGFTFRPIRNIDASQCKTVSGTVKDVHESGTNDITIALAEKDLSFYVNRGMDNGLDLGAFQDTLIGKKVSIWYVHQYSILTLVSSHKHISKLNIGNTTVWNELIEQ